MSHVFRYVSLWSKKLILLKFRFFYWLWLVWNINFSYKANSNVNKYKNYCLVYLRRMNSLNSLVTAPFLFEVTFFHKKLSKIFKYKCISGFEKNLLMIFLKNRIYYVLFNWMASFYYRYTHWALGDSEATLFLHFRSRNSWFKFRKTYVKWIFL